ncbi:hypothetical protein C8Q76DRAFT_749308 [Earliella scabrosa]|nr:hypothetical protein C8Q76DRAFT_749308 [Earliella scabrosa]
MPALVAVLFKVLVLAITAGVFACAITPPRPPVKPQDAGGVKVYKGQPFEYIVRYLAWLGCILVVLASASQCALLLLDVAASHTSLNTYALTPLLCPTTNTHPLALLTPRFLLGAALLLAGGTFRLQCYRALGAFFTYEVHVSSAHVLVTSGPYALVRHPSYTGLTALILGAQLMQFGRGAFVSECGIEGTWVGAFVRVWQYGSAFGLLSLYRRCAVEDRQLRERFGETWERYSAKVPYRLLPYVF